MKSQTCCGYVACLLRTKEVPYVGRIDSRILKQFGFDAAQASASPEISFHTLRTKKRRELLTDAEAERLEDLKVIRRDSRIRCLIGEIRRSEVSASALGHEADTLAAIRQSLEQFEPHILVLAGKRQIYWDLEGYLHIALRHVKDMQIGAFKGKTPFPYKAEDLVTLVEQVLRQIEGEIRQHFSAAPSREFRRHGKWAIYFNGDYFHVRIDAGGRLVQFHIVGEPRGNALC